MKMKNINNNNNNKSINIIINNCRNKLFFIFDKIKKKF